MNITIHPSPLHGTIEIPSSKSIGHRHIICAALANGESIVDNVSPSEDIEATCRVLEELGVSITKNPSTHTGRTTYTISGGIQPLSHAITADAGESGSTLRFLIPPSLLSHQSITFTGRGRLVSRPLTPYYDLFDEKGISYETTDGRLPLTVQGNLTSGKYELAGDVSSQFFSGLLFALPLLDGDSHLMSTTPLESASYVDMTLQCLHQHGIIIEKERDGFYSIPGKQQYHEGTYTVEGDYSQAAFWLAAGIIGRAICCTGLNPHSLQGDRVITDLIRSMGGRIEGETELTAHPSTLSGIVIDVEDCPDLVPILAVLASCSIGLTHIIHAGRVRLKECDRLHAMATELNAIGGDIQEEPEGLIIHGVPSFTGGVVNSWNDHRIAMALAIASQRATGPITIKDAQCVRKSYPEFWHDFKALGGIIDEEEILP